MKKLVFVSMMFVVFVMINSCSKSSGGTTGGGGGGGTVDCSTVNAKFAADVQPLINSSCAISGCHNGTQSPTLITYAQIAANAASINSQVQSGAMPKNSSFSPTQKNIIKCWVQSGSPNN
jgi:hypothetical protein